MSPFNVLPHHRYCRPAPPTPGVAAPAGLPTPPAFAPVGSLYAARQLDEATFSLVNTSTCFPAYLIASAPPDRPGSWTVTLNPALATRWRSRAGVRGWLLGLSGGMLEFLAAEYRAVGGGVSFSIGDILGWTKATGGKAARS